MSVPNNPTLVNLTEISFIMAGIQRELARGEIKEEHAQRQARAIMEAYLETANGALITAINDAIKEEIQ